MRTYYECLPCFVNQALGLLRRAGATERHIQDVMRRVFYELATIDFSATPPITARKIYRIVRTALNVNDPYAGEKSRFNEFALQLLAGMHSRINACRNAFAAKVTLAIAANIIDFGKNGNLTESEVRACLDRALETPVDGATVSRLEEAVQRAGRILYLCDNSGEIVFDRFLIEHLPYGKITCAVRGAPVLNDATMEDARDAGLMELVNVISNGSDAPGTILPDCSEEFKRAFALADLVISKGQGNFETLSDVKGKRIFFLLQIKCPVIARDAGLPAGTFAIIERGANGAVDAAGRAETRTMGLFYE